MQQRRTSRLIASVGLAAATLSVAPQPASAASITVTTTAVTIANDGLCSLPEAITAANTNTASGAAAGECVAGGASDQIFLPAGTISVGPAGLPAITTTVRITGGTGAVIDGTNAGTNPGLTVQGGDLFLDTVTVRSFAGGGIVSMNGALRIFQSWIHGNGTFAGQVGGISFESTTAVRRQLSVESSTISNNATSTDGGGLSIDGYVQAVVDSSTIANNIASGVGGGIAYLPISSSELDIMLSTIAGNDAFLGSGVYRNGTASFAVTSSIVASNVGTDVDGVGPYFSGGGNVIGFGTRSADFTRSDDIIRETAGVAPLADNGGPTPTMALLPFSPGIDRTLVLFSLVDQRGVDRPQGLRGDSGAHEFSRPELTMLAAPCTSYATLGNDGPHLQAGAPRTIPIAGRCGIPANATAVVFTVTAINPQALGNLRLSAAGVTPNGGVVNFANNGLNNSNTVTIDLSNQGSIDVSANGGTAPNATPLTDVLLQSVAYYAPTYGLDYFPLAPCAVADSRTTEGATGNFAGPYAGGGMPAIDVVGTFPAAQGGGNIDCGVPTTADAVVVNVVAVNATGPGTLAVPGFFSSVVAFDNIGMNNAVVAYLNLNGGQTTQITPLTGATTHVRVVILGYLESTTFVTGTAYTPVTPCTAFDTRTSEGATGAFAGLRNGDNVTTYKITGTIPAAQGGNGGNCGVPSNATAVLINLVAVNSVRAGNLQAYATGTAATGGVVNFAALTPPMNNANAVPIPINTSGQMNIRTNAGPSGVGQPTTHIRGIILGYYTN